MSPTCGHLRAMSPRGTRTGSSLPPKPDNSRRRIAVGGSGPSRRGWGRAVAATVVGGWAALHLLAGAASGAGIADLPSVDPLTLADTQLEPVQWTDLEGWSADDHL